MRPLLQLQGQTVPSPNLDPNFRRSGLAVVVALLSLLGHGDALFGRGKGGGGGGAAVSGGKSKQARSAAPQIDPEMLQSAASQVGQQQHRPNVRSFFFCLQNNKENARSLCRIGSRIGRGHLAPYIPFLFGISSRSQSLAFMAGITPESRRAKRRGARKTRG